jgi:stage II sporulation protein D
MIKKKTRLATLLALIICIFACCVIVILLLQEKQETDMYSDEYINADELPALFSFTYYDTKKWAKQLDFVSGRVSYKELEELLDLLAVTSYITYEKQSDWKNISRANFYKVYDQIVDILDVGKVVTNKNIIFLSESEHQIWLTQDRHVTLAGEIKYIKPFDMYETVSQGDQVLGIRKVFTDKILCENIFVHSLQGNELQMLLEKEMISLKIEQFPETITDTICDIEWSSGAISAIYKKEDSIEGSVLSYNENQIEISGYGSFQHDGNLKIYKTYGTVEQVDESKLVIGNLMAEFVIAKKEVCGIILKQPITAEEIRVLILNEGERYYKNVYLTADEDVTLTIGKTKKKIKAGKLIKASTYKKKLKNTFIQLETSSATGNLFLCNKKNEKISLGYSGSFEIRNYKEGYCVVNELSLEEYLCAVVPSEMPASYEIEALRAQAICARSYACIQLTNGQYAQYGANVDDSTNYQVYNKQEKNEKASLAVADTVGEVLKYNDEIAEAYYYSTSNGYSQDIDVWGFSDNDYAYLKSVPLKEKGKTLNLAKEKVFASYIKKKNVTAYDSESTFFRWKATVNFADYQQAVQTAVKERHTANSNHIKIYNHKNKEQTEIIDLGELTGMKVEKRSQGGALAELSLIYKKGRILIITEYNIRKILGAAVTAMTNSKDESIDPTGLLPSACFYGEAIKGGYALYGGGYGHGIGMSQYGANGMAKEGFTYMDILQKFYQNITIENIYNGQSG